MKNKEKLLQNSQRNSVLHSFALFVVEGNRRARGVRRDCHRGSGAIINFES